MLKTRGHFMVKTTAFDSILQKHKYNNNYI